MRSHSRAFCAVLSAASFAWLGSTAFSASRESVRLIGGTPTGPVPTLINGTPVVPAAWKNTVRIGVDLGGGSTGFCTASIVGPRVLATAAHCGSTGQTARFTLDGQSYSARITRHPYYVEGSSSRDLDLSLAILDRPIENIEYGVLPGRVDVVQVGMPIRLMGYGCIQSNGGQGGGGNDGILREGMSKVTGFTAYKFDIITGDVTGGGALCFGDSGGPAWLEVKEGTELVRYNISQNSKGDIARTSYLARWDVERAQTWVRDFVKTNAVEICGINRNCKVGTPKPNEPNPEEPAERVVNISGKSIAIRATLKDDTLDESYVNDLFQNLVRFLDTQ